MISKITDIFSAKKSAKKPVTGHSKVMKYANYIKTDSKGGLVIDINAGMWFNDRLSRFLISKMASFDPKMTSKWHSKTFQKYELTEKFPFLEISPRFWKYLRCSNHFRLQTALFLDVFVSKCPIFFENGILWLENGIFVEQN